MFRPSHLITALSFSILVATPLGCGAGSAGKAVRPDDPTAASALGDKNAGAGDSAAGSVACTKVAPKGEPLVVDWKTNEQLDLSVALKKGVGVVAYDCKTMRLLKNCSAKGRYGFTSVSSLLQETVKIEDADEARVSLPLGGASLSGEVSRGASIDIALAYVGKRAILDDAVAKTDLSGQECEQATHYIRAATVGAFVMETGTKGQARAAAEMLGAGASGASSSNKKRLNSGGDVSACKSLKDGMTDPPEGCSAIVRLELAAFAADADAAGGGGGGGGGGKGAKETLENTCPDGFAPSGGHCAKKGGGAAYRCQPDDAKECKAQCDNGNADSCYSASQLPLDSRQDYKLLLRKACDGNVAVACVKSIWEYMPGLVPNPDLARAGEFAKKGCDLLHAGGCDAASDIVTTPAEKELYKSKACELGRYDSCMGIATWDITGKGGHAKRTKDGLAILDTWCDAGKQQACKELASLYGLGQMSNMKEPADVTPDAAKASTYQEKYCKSGGRGCDIKIAGEYTSATSKGVIKVVQAADKVRFTTDAYGTVDCSAGKTMRCSWSKGTDAKSSGTGILEVKADGKLAGSYVSPGSNNEVRWEFVPKKKN